LYAVWKRWLAQYRYYYNETISLLRCYDGVEKLNAETLDKYLQRLENTPDWVTSIPGHQRQEACFEAYDAFNRAKKDGGFAKFKTAKATAQTIQFQVGN
jgi:putative transposase